jgi:hypothetical protein
MDRNVLANLCYVVDIGVSRNEVSKTNREQADEAEVGSIHVVPSLYILYTLFYLFWYSDLHILYY